MSFDDFLESIATVPAEMLNWHFAKQAWSLAEPMKDPRVHLFKMENLGADWPGIAKQIHARSGHAPDDLETFNATKAGQSHGFTARQRHLIEYCHGADFETFGYGWDAEGQPCVVT